MIACVYTDRMKPIFPLLQASVSNPVLNAWDEFVFFSLSPPSRDSLHRKNHRVLRFAQRSNMVEVHGRQANIDPVSECPIWMTINICFGAGQWFQTRRYVAFHVAHDKARDFFIFALFQFPWTGEFEKMHHLSSRFVLQFCCWQTEFIQ
jgi:hypothetical protein